MGQLKERFLVSEDPEHWYEVQCMAMLGFPEARVEGQLSLEPIAALPAGIAISAAMRVSSEGSVTASLHQFQKGRLSQNVPGLIKLVAPALISGVRLFAQASTVAEPDCHKLTPCWVTLGERSKAPKPQEQNSEPDLRLPVSATAWPWDLERALAILSANGGGRLGLTVRHLPRKASVTRTLNELHGELLGGSYAIPDEPAILQALSAVRAMREDPALFGFEVVISGEKITKTVCNLVALALFGTLADHKDTEVGDHDIRLIAGCRHVPARITLTAEECARLLSSQGQGRNYEQRGWIVGVAAGDAPVYLSKEARARHLYIIGATGTGKSTLLKTLMRQDFEAGEGVILIDPHGDLAREAVLDIPEDRHCDLIFADAADLAGRFAINLLPDSAGTTSFEIASDMLISIFKDTLYDNVNEAFGPVFEQYFRNSLALLMSAEPIEKCLSNLPRVFEDREFRSRLLNNCQDNGVVSFWRKTALQTSGEVDLPNVTPYITGKLTRLIGTTHARLLFPASGRCLNFAEAMDNGKILILRCPNGALGEGLAELAMSACLMQIRAVAMAREATNVRRPVRLYIDEFQGCRGKALQSLLAEGRKFGLSLVLANQSLGQIGGTSNRSVGSATLANVGNLITFRVGATDAMTLAPWFDRPDRWRELCQLPDFTMQARLLEKGRPMNLSGLRIPMRSPDIPPF